MKTAFRNRHLVIRTGEIFLFTIDQTASVRPDLLYFSLKLTLKVQFKRQRMRPTPVLPAAPSHVHAHVRSLSPFSNPVMILRAKTRPCLFSHWVLQSSFHNFLGILKHLGGMMRSILCFHLNSRNHPLLTSWPVLSHRLHDYQFIRGCGPGALPALRDISWQSVIYFVKEEFPPLHVSDITGFRLAFSCFMTCN